jgi:DNA repair exonuclease SbcCD ATPase subunit
VQNIRSKKLSGFLVVSFLLIFFLGYAVFFLSPYYLSGVGKLNYTPLREPVVLEYRDIQILSWSYCKDQKRMEVELQIDDHSFDGRNTYSFSAAFRPSNASVEITTVLEEPNYVVIEIDNIPRRWREISLRMRVEDAGTEEIRLYSNIEQIAQVDSIEPLTQLEYHVRRIERNIAAFTDRIEEIDQELQELSDKIVNIQEANRLLEDGKKYQTTVEIEETNLQISANLDAIEETEKEMETLRGEKQEQENLILQAQDRLKELQNEEM